MHDLLLNWVIVWDSEEQEGILSWWNCPGFAGITSSGWTAIGAAAGIIAAALIFAVLVILGRKGKGPLKSLGSKSPKETVPAAVSMLTVEKLHEQGARNSQQDSFFVSAEEASDNLLAIVSDGMGGLSDGDKVSQTAVGAAAEAFYNTAEPDPQRLLLELLRNANNAVNNLLGYNGIYQSGATMVAGLIKGQDFYYISVGDSRIYLYRDGGLFQLNREHVYRNELYTDAVNGGNTLASADAHPKGAGLTSFLGMGELKHIDIPAQPVSIRPGDRFLLMSDGVYNALPDEEMCEALVQDEALAAQLLNTAIKSKAYRNQDNYTAVIINCR